MARKKIDLWEDAKKKQAKENEWIRGNSQYSSAKKAKNESIDKESYINEDGNKVIIEEKIVYKENPKKFKKDNSKAKSSGLIAVVVTILIAVIAIPLIVLFGLTSWAVDNVTKMTSDIGYTTETEFTIKHEASGKYIKDPSYQGQQVLATDTEWADASKFRFVDDKGKLYLESTKYYGNSQMVLSIEGSIPVWGPIQENHSLSIYQKDNENLYSIRFLNNGDYLSLNENSTQLSLSNEEDWFEFYAVPTENDIVKTGYQFDRYFNQIHKYDGNESFSHYPGTNGTPITIMDVSTGKYLNTFGTMQLEADSDTNMFITSNYISAEEDIVPNNWIGDTIPGFYEDGSFIPVIDENQTPLYIGSYQNLSLVPHFKTTKFTDLYYPLLTASNTEDEASFVQYEYGHQLKYTNLLARVLNEAVKSYGYAYFETLVTDGAYKESDYVAFNYFKGETHTSYIPEAVVWLVPNPTNWTQRMIYFPLFDKYIQVDDGRVISESTPDGWEDSFTKEHWEGEFNPSFFTFDSIGHYNPELFSALPMLDSQSKTYFNVQTEQYREVKDITINAFDWSEFVTLVLNGADADRLNKFFTKPLVSNTKIPKKEHTIIKLDNLEESLTYVGTVTITRENDDVGKHTSTRFIPYLFGNSWIGGGCGCGGGGGGGGNGGGGNIDWPDIDWPEIEPPEKPDLIQEAEWVMWNSTEVGHTPKLEPPTNPSWPTRSVEGVKPGASEKPHGIDIKESDTKAEASILFKNGLYSNNSLQYKLMTINLHELDSTGKETGLIIYGEEAYKPSATEELEYHFTYEGLVPETDYNAVLSLDGEEMEMPSGIDEDIAKGDKTEYYFNTERTWPEITTSSYGEDNTVSSTIRTFNLLSEDRLRLITEETNATGDYKEVNLSGGTLAGNTDLYKDMNDSDGILYSDLESYMTESSDGAFYSTGIKAPVQEEHDYKFRLILDVSAYYDGWEQESYWTTDGIYEGSHQIVFDLGEYSN